MKLRRFTKFGIVNRVVRLIFCFDEKLEKRDIVEVGHKQITRSHRITPAENTVNSIRKILVFSSKCFTLVHWKKAITSDKKAITV